MSCALGMRGGSVDRVADGRRNTTSRAEGVNVCLVSSWLLLHIPMTRCWAVAV